MLGSNFKGSKRFGEIFSLCLESWCVWCVWCEVGTNTWSLGESYWLRLLGGRARKAAIVTLVSVFVLQPRGISLVCRQLGVGAAAISWLTWHFRLEFL